MLWDKASFKGRAMLRYLPDMECNLRTIGVGDNVAPTALSSVAIVVTDLLLVADAVFIKGQL